MLAVVVVATIVASMLQGGIHFKKFTPSFEHFNLVKGVGRIFGKQALWEGAKALLKTAVVGLVLWVAIQGLVPLLMDAGGLPVSSLLEHRLHRCRRADAGRHRGRASASPCSTSSSSCAATARRR